MANTYGRQVVEALTNKSGGGVVAGDVVVIDTTNNDAFTTSTAGSFTGMVGVAQETIAANAVGRVLTAGYAALVNVNASVTRGNYGITYTVAKQATDGGATRIVGAFCQFLTGGTTPDAHVFGITDASTGAGGAPSSSKYVTTAYDGTLSAEVVIPGFSGSPDIKPASPNAADDEFDTTSTFSTTLGSLDSNNTTDFASHLHIAKTTSGTRIDGVYKTAPGMPFTITAKIADMRWSFTQYQSTGILLTETSPGKCFTIGPLYTSTAMDWDWSRWTNNTTRGTFGDTATLAPTIRPWPYLRAVVHASNNIDFLVSYNGLVWVTAYTGLDSGLTVANAGLYVSGFAAIAMEAVYDWVRFA